MKILIGSPDTVSGDILRNALSPLGADIHTTHSHAEFGVLCRTERFDVILSLFLAPFVCGDDVAHTIPQRRIGSPKVFVLSWYNCEYAVTSALESGVDQFLSLPITPARLCAKISSDR